MEITIERIAGKYHATFKHGNQKFIIHSITGTKKDAEYQKEMLTKCFSKCPRCASDLVTINGDMHYCPCGAVW